MTKLVVLEGDIATLEHIALDGFDAIIHLASIANDPAVIWIHFLLGKQVVLQRCSLLTRAAQSDVSQFIYAS